MRKTLIAGNWKMNGLRADLTEIQAMGKGATPALRAKADLLICPPATLVFTAAAVCIGTGIGIGAQDCHAKASGRIRVISLPPCCSKRGRAQSSSAIPNVALTMPRRMLT